MVLNGDILEYEGVGLLTLGEGINDQAIGGTDVETLIMFMDFIGQIWTNYYSNNLRLRGGFKWKEIGEEIGNRMATSMVRSLGPTGVDFIQRHVFTDRYRKAYQQRLDAEMRSGLVPHKKTRSTGHTRSQKKMKLKKTPLKGRWDYPWRPQEEEAVVFARYDAEQAQRQNNINLQDIDMPKQRSAAGMMLDFKNRLTRKFHTEMFYMMHPALVTQTVDTKVYHWTDEGNGPHLYTTYQNQLASAGKRFTGFNFPYPMDQGAPADDCRGVGRANIVYVFAADWPFSIMNHDPRTQDTANKETGEYLEWAYRNYTATTDQDLPIEIDRVFKNDDWTYLTHYYTVYRFDFTNISNLPYVIEILYFTFKADPDTMDYRKQSLAITRRQTFGLQEWIAGVSGKPADINIIHKKRIYLKGMENHSVITPNGGANVINAQLPNQFRENSGTYKYVVKRKYVIKRPINTTYQHDISEAVAFNTYYEPAKGVYCRVQAWPLESAFYIEQSANTGIPKIDTIEYSHNIKTGGAATELGLGVSVMMNKKSYFKLDEPMYRSYAAA